MPARRTAALAAITVAVAVTVAAVFTAAGHPWVAVPAALLAAITARRTTLHAYDWRDAAAHGQPDTNTND
jgi:hypothetical protein